MLCVQLPNFYAIYDLVLSPSGCEDRSFNENAQNLSCLYRPTVRLSHHHTPPVKTLTLTPFFLYPLLGHPQMVSPVPDYHLVLD